MHPASAQPCHPALRLPTLLERVTRRLGCAAALPLASRVDASAAAAAMLGASTMGTAAWGGGAQRVPVNQCGSLLCTPVRL